LTNHPSRRNRVTGGQKKGTVPPTADWVKTSKQEVGLASLIKKRLNCPWVGNGGITFLGGGRQEAVCSSLLGYGEVKQRKKARGLGSPRTLPQCWRPYKRWINGQSKSSKRGAKIVIYN